MTTRRDIIKGGIAATSFLIGKGISSSYGEVPKGLLGARGMMAADSSWRNPYITDGLVAMWDAEWNAGGGVHDPNATVWKDLSGRQKDFVWASGTSGLAWADNYLQLTNANKNTIDISYVDDTTGLSEGVARTVEIVMAANWIYTDNVGNIQAPLLLIGSAVPVGRWNGEISPYIVLQNTRNAFSRTGIPFTNWKVVSACVAQQPVSPCRIYANGATAIVSQDYTGSTQQIYDRAMLQRPPRADMRLFSIRIYSRALTADEIATNYAVDKQRFNLP